MKDFPKMRDDAYVSTETVQKGSWLIPTSKLMMLDDHPFSKDIIRVYGLLPDKDTYVIESLQRAIKYKYNARPKIIIGISRQELERQLACGFWQCIEAVQWNLLNDLSREAQRAMDDSVAQAHKNASIAAKIPRGWMWRKDLKSGFTVLAHSTQPSEGRLYLGMYKETDNGMWLCVHLDVDNTKPPRRNFTHRKLGNELDCQACIIWCIESIDPKGRCWPLDTRRPRS